MINQKPRFHLQPQMNQHQMKQKVPRNPSPLQRNYRNLRQRSKKLTKPGKLLSTMIISSMLLPRKKSLVQLRSLKQSHPTVSSSSMDLAKTRSLGSRETHPKPCPSSLPIKATMSGSAPSAEPLLQSTVSTT